MSSSGYGSSVWNHGFLESSARQLQYIKVDWILLVRKTKDATLATVWYCSFSITCIVVCSVLAIDHNAVRRDAKNYIFSAIHSTCFACRGLIKILSVAAVVLWYCRIRHRSLQDFRLACFEYKHLILQKSYGFYVSFPRVESWKNGSQAGCCHVFACHEGISSYFPIVAIVDWISLASNWQTKPLRFWRDVIFCRCSTSRCGRQKDWLHRFYAGIEDLARCMLPEERW